jgi:hypothetical protein
MFRRKKVHHYFWEKLLDVIGIVLIWRGIWHALDSFDVYFFGRSHWISALIGVFFGFLLLYIPDKNLDEI